MTSSLPAVPSILDEREDLGLTDRELEVLALIAEGQSNGSIAGALLIAEATVKRHVYQLMRKLEVRSRSQAVALARRLGAIGL
ncbi:MAG: helix-turn-helix transcriptional regulator [Pseudolysinimonas sp.]|uniref:helix-turn-helix domain-containing protein n=1 Tax=Pseudolysinimonas sp. TaxID=2680009 RepID=UPI003263FEF1